MTFLHGNWKFVFCLSQYMTSFTTELINFNLEWIPMYLFLVLLNPLNTCRWPLSRGSTAILVTFLHGNWKFVFCLSQYMTSFTTELINFNLEWIPMYLFLVLKENQIWTFRLNPVIKFYRLWTQMTYFQSSLLSIYNPILKTPNPVQQPRATLTTANTYL